MMIKSVSLSFEEDFEIIPTREGEEETDLIAVKDMLRQNSDFSYLMIMILTLQGELEGFEISGNTCTMNVHNPICELHPEYDNLDRPGRVYLEDMIEMMWLRLEIQYRLRELKKLKENRFFGMRRML